LNSRDIVVLQQFLRDTLYTEYTTTFLRQFLYTDDAYAFCSFKHDTQDIVGVVCGRIRGSISDNTSGSAHLMIIAVDAGWRKVGLGSFLLQKFESSVHFKTRKEDHSLNSIYLQVSCKNQGAIKFYEKEGFRTEKVEERYYGRYGDCFVMRKTI
ncbi:acyl-CoA N-acyltransferase, partial [Dipodascopsis uninucleata]